MGFIKVKLWINDCWLVSRGSYTNQYSNNHNPSTGNPYPTSTESDGVGSFLYTAKGCVLKMGKPERKPWKGHGFDFYVFSWDDNQQWLICWNLVSPFLPYPGMMYICLFTIAIYLRWDEVASRQQVIFFVDTNMVRQPGAHREKHWIVGESVKARFHQLDETGMV